MAKVKIISVNLLFLNILCALTGSENAIFASSVTASAAVEIKKSTMCTAHGTAIPGIGCTGRMSCFLSAGDYHLRRGYVRPPACRIGLSKWGSTKHLSDMRLLKLSSSTSSTSHNLVLPMAPASHIDFKQHLPPHLAGVIGRRAQKITLAYSAQVSDGNGSGGDSVGPPAYNGNDIAAEVFKDPYFYNLEIGYNNIDRREKRLGELGDMTINECHRRGIEETDVFASLVKRIDAIPDRVSAYFEAADIKTKQSIAEEVLKKRYQCKFHSCSISLGDSLHPLDSLLQDDERMITLDFLDALRLGDVKDDFFVPKSIYVRECMRKVFGLFQEDIATNKKPGSRATALIGSPGVGKSVLFFLAALYCSQSIPVVYFRRTARDDEKPSVFVLTPETSGSVRIWFTRNIAKRTLEHGLAGLQEDLGKKLGIHPEDYYAFVDGPRRESIYTSDLLYGDYDYFCTSGGFPRYKNEERRKRLWILDGWTEKEAIEAFARNLPTYKAGIKVRGSLDRMKTRKAKEVYTLCGGIIRDMIGAWDDENEAKVELNSLVGDLDAKMVQLAVTSTDRQNPKTNSDRLRTMFAKVPDASTGETWKWRMQPYQVVDSRYLLNKLVDLLEGSTFFGAYLLSGSNGLASSQGMFFEWMIHHCVMKYMCPQPVIDGSAVSAVWEVCQSTGTKIQGVNQLVRPNMYWLPSVSNFPNIDSAIVVDNTLHAFSMTIMNKKKFQISTFETQFLNRLQRKKAFPQLKQQVYIHYLVPDGIQFKKPAAVKDITFSVHHVRTTSAHDVLDSVRRLLVELGHGGAVTKTVSTTTGYSRGDAVYNDDDDNNGDNDADNGDGN